MLINYKQKRFFFVGSIFLISLTSLFFIIINFRENIVFFYSPSELKERNIIKKIDGKKVRIGGLVKEKTIKKISNLETSFVVSDLENEIEIIYKGLLPDLFREKQGVIAIGIFNSQKKDFFTEELLVKHDENYMPPEIKNSLKK
jgi:cytochrome c-type biogenesis protein CcmE